MSGKSVEDVSAAMPAPGMLSNGSQSSLIAESIKSAVALSIQPIAADDVEITAHNAVNGNGTHKTNGKVNGNHVHADALTIASPPIEFRRAHEVASKTRARIVCELEDVTESYFETTDPDSYFEYIADERLTHMPARGSQWDRVLKEAEFFGYQISNFASHLDAFVKEWQLVRDIALASCKLLLEVHVTSPSRHSMHLLTTSQARLRTSRGSRANL
jgi:hypothetical protein